MVQRKIHLCVKNATINAIKGLINFNYSSTALHILNEYQLLSSYVRPSMQFRKKKNFGSSQGLPIIEVFEN